MAPLLRQTDPRQSSTEDQSDDQQVRKDLGQEAQGNDKIVSRHAGCAKAQPEPSLNRSCSSRPQPSDDEAPREEGPVIDSIGQHPPDTEEIAEDRRIHQRAGKDPGGYLA